MYRYNAELGGEVHLMGKPAAVIYTRVMEMTGVSPEDAIAVGDSLEHDIAGAAGWGLVFCVPSHSKSQCWLIFYLLVERVWLHIQTLLSACRLNILLQ